MTNEQLVIRICAGIDEADNTLQLWQQNRGYINKIVNHYKAYAEEEDLQHIWDCVKQSVIIILRKKCHLLLMPVTG